MWLCARLMYPPTHTSQCQSRVTQASCMDHAGHVHVSLLAHTTTHMHENSGRTSQHGSQTIRVFFHHSRSCSGDPRHLARATSRLCASCFAFAAARASRLRFEPPIPAATAARSPAIENDKSHACPCSIDMMFALTLQNLCTQTSNSPNLSSDTLDSLVFLRPWRLYSHFVESNHRFAQTTVDTIVLKGPWQIC